MVLDCVVLQCTALCYIEPHRVVRGCVTLRGSVLRHVASCYNVLYCDALHFHMMCCIAV